MVFYWLEALQFSSSRTRRVFKEPSVFDGNQATFKEWTFAMELTLRSLAFADPTEDVDYDIGYCLAMLGYG